MQPAPRANASWFTDGGKMSIKVCPVCDRSWGNTFKFCPEDGAALDVAKPAPSARRGVDRRGGPVDAAPAAGESARTAPTVVMEAVSKKTVPPESSASRKQRKGFSETAWFMQKIDPNMVDPETGRVIADTTAAPSGEIDAETRKRYSLRGEDEE
jgi:hypothetical protein